MYNSGRTHLGQTPTTPEKPWWEKLTEQVVAIGTKGYQAYATREQAIREADIMKKRIDSERQITAMRAGIVPSGFQRFMPSSFRPTTGVGMDWTMPVILGVGALGVVALTMGRKRR